MLSIRVGTQCLGVQKTLETTAGFLRAVVLRVGSQTSSHSTCNLNRHTKFWTPPLTRNGMEPAICVLGSHCFGGEPDSVYHSESAPKSWQFGEDAAGEGAGSSRVAGRARPGMFSGWSLGSALHKLSCEERVVCKGGKGQGAH